MFNNMTIRRGVSTIVVKYEELKNQENIRKIRDIRRSSCKSQKKQKSRDH